MATTVEAIAVDADVSAKTVYDAFSTKAGVLRAVWDLRLKGDTDDAPVAARPWYVALLEEPDPHRMVDLIARHSVVVKQRIGDVLRIIRSAASVDADSAALWQLITTDFHANQRVLVEAIAKRKALRPGLTVRQATDVLWTLNHPDTWLNLHEERGWSAKQFEKWFSDSARLLLLRGNV